MENDFLGRGWSFPVALNEKADGFSMSAYEKDIEQAIYIILFTAKGERLMHPDFGCGIHSFVFSIMNTTTITLLEQSVREALEKWEPRISLDNVKVKYEPSPGNKCLINIDYVVRATNDRRNMVYPFYLNE